MINQRKKPGEKSKLNVLHLAGRTERTNWELIKKVVEVREPGETSTKEESARDGTLEGASRLDQQEGRKSRIKTF